MDLMNRGERPVQQNTPNPNNGVGAPRPLGSKGPKKLSGKWSKYLVPAFFAAVTILALALVLSLFLSKGVTGSEQDKVSKDKFQAVFLNGGQVYFGKISDLNSRNLTLDNIYYLRVNQQVQPNQEQTANQNNDISLVKLGCELHGPEDSMVINREQIIFWENLKTDGQVAKAVAEYVKANPNGQNCEQQNSGNANTPATTPPATTPPATTPPAGGSGQGQ